MKLPSQHYKDIDGKKLIVLEFRKIYVHLLKIRSLYGSFW